MSEPSRPISTDRHTPGPWRAEACGGFSTVICPQEPARADNRIPAYAYNHEKGYCVAYPFADDGDRSQDGVRWDFVCFSHADARLIAAAPELLEALKNLLRDEKLDDDDMALRLSRSQARAAIAKAEGRS